MPKVAVQLEDAGYRHRQAARKAAPAAHSSTMPSVVGHGAHQWPPLRLDAFITATTATPQARLKLQQIYPRLNGTSLYPTSWCGNTFFNIQPVSIAPARW